MKLLNYFKSHDEGFNINLLPDGVVIIEQDGKITNVNQKVLQIYGLKKFEIIGHYFSDFVEKGTTILNQIVSSGKSEVAKAIIKNEDENTINKVFLELTAARDKDTNKVYIIVRNATNKRLEQKTIVEKFDMAQKVIDGKNEFLLDSSGAILSSLVSISGFSRALLDGIGGALTDKQEKYLNIINANSKDLKYDLEKLFALFEAESKKQEYNCKLFDLMSLIKSIERVYQKEFSDRKILFSLDYSSLTQRDCNLDSEIIEFILRSIMDIFVRFAHFGKCSMNIGHPPLEFLKEMDFESNNNSSVPEKYVLFEAKIADLIFNKEELNNIFNTYYKGANKRPIGLRATLNLLKRYITDFKGGIWVYSKENFGTMITFVLPLG